MDTLLSKDETGVLIIDAQKRLMAVMRRKALIEDNILKLIRLAELFDLPVMVTEQDKLGPTLEGIREALPSFEPLKKRHFDCCEVDIFNDRLASTGRKRLIVTGAETHICVYQTVFSLLGQGYEVHVPRDAVDSRTEENWQVGLGLMEKKGAVITSTETVIFQVLKQAGTPAFKTMLKVVK